MVILYTIGAILIEGFLKYYKNLRSIKSVFLFASMNKILHHQNPDCVIPVMKALLYFGGIFYIIKTLFSRHLFLILNRNKPVAVILLFLLKTFLDTILLENVTIIYNFHWAEMLHVYGDIHQNPGYRPM